MSDRWKQGKNGQTLCQSLNLVRYRLAQGLFLGRREIPANPSVMTKRRKMEINLRREPGLDPIFKPVLVVSHNQHIRHKSHLLPSVHRSMPSCGCISAWWGRQTSMVSHPGSLRAWSTLLPYENATRSYRTPFLRIQTSGDHGQDSKRYGVEDDLSILW